MKKNWIKIAAAGALAAGLVFAQTTPAHPPAQTQPPAQTHNRVARRAMMRHRMMQQLNLTEAQRQQAKAIFQQARQSSQPVAQQLKQDREAMRAAVKANDSAKIQQLSATAGKLRGEIMATHASAMAKFYQTLTPEQRAKADQMAMRIRNRRHATGA
jgi:Spy/CpxP family protein refolding chaperone